MPFIAQALAPLRVRPFARLLTSYTVNSIGDSLGIVALAILVYAKTRDPFATTALFIAAEFLPAFLAPVLTARVDQLSLRRVLPVIYLVEAGLFGLMAVVASDFVLTLILALTFADGVFMLTARGLTRGALNGVLAPEGLLREGNGLVNIGFAVSSVGGAALGGLLVQLLGVSTALAVDAASFAVIALLLATSRGLPAAHEEREPFLPRFREGLRFARTDRFARLLLVGQGIALVCFTIVVPIEIVYAKETLDTTDAGYGLLLSAWGAGIVLGSVVFVAVKSRSPFALVLVSTAAIGAAYLGMAATSSLGIACAFSVLGGAGNGVQWVAVMTALQEATPRDLQARITGLLESIASGMTGVGFVLGGLIVSLTSPPVAFTVSGAGVLVLVLFASLSGPAAWRRQAEPTPATDELWPRQPPPARPG